MQVNIPLKIIGLGRYLPKTSCAQFRTRSDVRRACGLGGAA
jgi:hypothetical protein